MTADPRPPVVELVIPGWVPDAILSENGRHRAHWSVLKRATAEVQEQTAAAILAWAYANQGGFARSRLPHFAHARVTIAYTFPQRRRRDAPGLLNRAKHILDTLVAQGILADDSMDVIGTPQVECHIEQGKTETRILVEGE